MSLSDIKSFIKHLKFILFFCLGIYVNEVLNLCFIHQREHTFHWTRLNSEVFFSLRSLKTLLHALWVFVSIKYRYMSVLWEALKIETCIQAGPSGMPFSLQSPLKPFFGSHTTLPRLRERLFWLALNNIGWSQIVSFSKITWRTTQVQLYCVI